VAAGDGAHTGLAPVDFRQIGAVLVQLLVPFRVASLLGLQELCPRL